MSELKLAGSVFIDCSFLGCNLSNVKIDGCSFRRITFKECKLIGVVFTRVNPFLLDWSFHQCKIEMCDFSVIKMKRSRFIECTIWKTDFVSADLSGSDFSGSDLNGSKFHQTILEKSNFSGAIRYDIDPSDNKVKHAKFSFPDVLALLTSFDIKIEE